MSDESKADEVLVFTQQLVEWVNARKYFPRDNVYLDMVVLALLSKSLLVSQAVCKLTREGFPEEAFGLTRTRVDIYLTVRYIANKDSEERASKFAHFFAKDREDWSRIIEKYYPHTQMNWIEYPPEVLEKAKEYKHPHRWTGLADQTKQMAIEEDTHDLDSKGNAYKAEFAYEVIYKWTSHYVHPTVVVLDTHIAERTQPFVVHARRHLGQRLEPLALFNAVTYLNLIFICVLRSLGDELPLDLAENFTAHARSL